MRFPCRLVVIEEPQAHVATCINLLACSPLCLQTSWEPNAPREWWPCTSWACTTQFVNYQNIVRLTTSTIWRDETEYALQLRQPQTFRAKKKLSDIGKGLLKDLMWVPLCFALELRWTRHGCVVIACLHSCSAAVTRSCRELKTFNFIPTSGDVWRIVIDRIVESLIMDLLLLHTLDIPPYLNSSFIHIE